MGLGKVLDNGKDNGQAVQSEGVRMRTDIMDEEGEYLIELVGNETQKGTIGEIGVGRVEIVRHGRNGILKLGLQHVDLIGAVLAHTIPDNDIHRIVDTLQLLCQRIVYSPSHPNTHKSCQLIELRAEKVN